MFQNGDARYGLQSWMLSYLAQPGVALMIFESGMHFDFEKAKKVGPWKLFGVEHIEDCSVRMFRPFRLKIL